MLFEFPLIKTISFLIGNSAANFPYDQTELRLGSSMPGGPTDFSQLEPLTILNQKNGEPSP